MIDNLSTDLAVLRERETAAREELARRRPAEGTGGRPRAILCKTTKVASYPTSAQVNAYYAVQAQTTGGPEKEGGAPAFSNLGQPFFAANIGSTWPPVGTQVVVVPVPGGRWIFSFNGPSDAPS